jgi:hypothetical protein
VTLSSASIGWPIDAEVGLDDLRVGAHVRGLSFGDLLAVVDDDDAVRDVITTCMLCSTSTIASPRSRSSPIRRTMCAALLVIHARCGLVEQQHGGPRSERLREFEQSLIAVGELLCGQRCLAEESDTLQRLASARRGSGSSRASARPPRRRTSDSGANTSVFWNVRTMPSGRRETRAAGESRRRGT